jgi:hypothetical protein
MSSFREHAWRLVVLGCALLAFTARASAEEARGVLVGVDTTKNELHLDSRGRMRGTLTFALDDKTLVLFGSEKGTANDLKAGRRIRVEYQEDGNGQRIARVIHSPGRPAAAAPAKSAPVVASAGANAINGVLQRVARADREVVVIGPGAKGPETETTVAVPEAAKIVKEGKPSSLEALKEGDVVAIRVERRANNQVIALEVQAGPGAALSATPAAAERSRVVPRLRQALHLADELLRRMDPEDANGKKP